LFTASVLPTIAPDLRVVAPLDLGIEAVLLVYFVRPSVILSTLAGAFAYGLDTLLLG
jgi:hypothetical protein